MTSPRTRPAHRLVVCACWLGALPPTLACGGEDPVVAGDDAITDTQTETGGEHAPDGTTEPAPTEPPGAGSSSAATEDSGTDAPGDDVPGPPVECRDASLGPGSYDDLVIEHEGRVRTFDLFVPSRVDAMQAIPLVVNMHGWGSDEQRQAEFSEMSEDAQARGYAIAYPRGVEASWNGGICCGGATTEDVDDVGFLVALVEHLQVRVCIDRARVYATGFSNGGYMAYRLACEAADVFAAIAPVAAVMGIAPEDCEPAQPVSVIHFHGTADFNVAYDGRPWLGVPGAPEVVQDWAARNGCDPASIVTSEEDDVTCETWPSCASGTEVTLCTIDGAGHCWPGNAECPYGDSSTTISANHAMFDAFDRHAR